MRIKLDEALSANIPPQPRDHVVKDYFAPKESQVVLFRSMANKMIELAIEAAVKEVAPAKDNFQIEIAHLNQIIKELVVIKEKQAAELQEMYKKFYRKRKPHSETLTPRANED